MLVFYVFSALSFHLHCNYMFCIFNLGNPVIAATKTAPVTLPTVQHTNPPVQHTNPPVQHTNPPAGTTRMYM